MDDPSQCVPPALLEHVHLISNHRYPAHINSLPLTTIADFLIKAPQVIRHAASVSWQYLRPPPDSTIFLAWQPPNHPSFATDGYVWPAPEALFTKSAGPYTVELLLIEQGYVPGSEARATHRRVRYRLKGAPPGEQIDPCLEIVHYTQSPTDKQRPVNELPANPRQQQHIQHRRYLEEAGTLERKDFMFSDRANWPKITLPGSKNPTMAHPGFGGRPPVPGMPGMTRPGGPAQAFLPPGAAARAGGMGQPPAKRPRPVGVPGMARPGLPGAAMSSSAEAEMIDEETPAIGDFLDLLSPREISATRYSQHHEWMEEVVATPYAINQILPDNPNFKLSGDLAELTKDLFDTSNPNEPLDIKQDQVEELERRVAAFQQKGHEEIDTMKARHYQKMEELKTEKLFVDLERRLANIPHDDPNAGDEVQRLVNEAEQVTGSKLMSREEVVQIRKGGLLDRQEAAAMQLDNQPKDESTQQQDEFGEFTNLDSAGEALDFYSGSYDDSGMTFGNT